MLTPRICENLSAQKADRRDGHKEEGSTSYYELTSKAPEAWNRSAVRATEQSMHGKLMSIYACQAPFQLSSHLIFTSTYKAGTAVTSCTGMQSGT